MAVILDFLVGSCLEELKDIITERATMILGVKDDLIELEETMDQIKGYLDDAEKRRESDPNVNRWANKLTDALYYADDIIDLARSEGGKLLAEDPSSSTKSTRCIGISFFACFCNIGSRHKVAIEIRDFKVELTRILEDGKRDLEFKDMLCPVEDPTENQKVTMSLVEPNLVGKEIIPECKTLVDELVKHNKKEPYMLVITGAGGIGKTTLAKIIYNDPRIEGAFSYPAWICVPRKYSKVALLKEVLQNFGADPGQDKTYEQLNTSLADVTRNESFSLVLDDVWNPDVWTDLLSTPLHGATSGVIIVTARNDTVARTIGAQKTYEVGLMPAYIGWELLQKSMYMKEEDDVQQLEEIGLEIVEKFCRGLPLAIIVIAKVLATKEKTINEWKKVLDGSANHPDNLGGPLYSGYHDLPGILKQCFLYFALYPEDHCLYRDDLIRLWVAEGYIEKRKGQLLEETAQEYYYELIHRHLIQPDGTYFDNIRCKMHGLLRELACDLTAEECFFGYPSPLNERSMSKVRRISVVREEEFPSMDIRRLKVRSLIMLSRVSQEGCCSVIEKLLRLRVLDLAGSSVEIIPDFIDQLIHLRLLVLDGTIVSSLPESIGSLINLQTLSLQGCIYLHMLPLAITQLCNLRRLGIGGGTPINVFPKGIGKLEFLNDLESFVAGGGTDDAEEAQDGWELEELRRLSQLRRLHMIRLERAAAGSSEPLLKNKIQLKKLDLCCTAAPENEPYSDEAVRNIDAVFANLTPPDSLEDLGISGFFGRTYPTWLGTAILSSLKHLILVDCISWLHLPSTGRLPNLEFLRIEGAAAVTKLGPEFLCCKIGSTTAAAFPRLKSWVINNMPNWEDWCIDEENAAAPLGGDDRITEVQKGKAILDQSTENSIISFRTLLPRLEWLELVGCPKLKALPRQLGKHATNLKELQLVWSDRLQVVEDLPFLSHRIFISACKAVNRVSHPHTCLLSIKVANFKGLWNKIFINDSCVFFSDVDKNHKKEEGKTE